MKALKIDKIRFALNLVRFLFKKKTLDVLIFRDEAYVVVKEKFDKSLYKVDAKRVRSIKKGCKDTKILSCRGYFLIDYYNIFKINRSLYYKEAELLRLKESSFVIEKSSLKISKNKIELKINKNQIRFLKNKIEIFYRNKKIFEIDSLSQLKINFYKNRILILEKLKENYFNLIIVNERFVFKRNIDLTKVEDRFFSKDLILDVIKEEEFIEKIESNRRLKKLKRKKRIFSTYKEI